MPFIRSCGEEDGDDSVLAADSRWRQQALCREIARSLRVAARDLAPRPTAHPFAGGPGGDDMRITTHYDETDATRSSRPCTSTATGSTSTRSPRRARRTPLGGGCSLGLHESQSRMWENLVGRSRRSGASSTRACRRLPRAARRRGAERFYRAVNRVQPVADPDPRRRGHLQHAHHPALRARAGHDRRAASTSPTCPRSGTGGWTSTSGIEVPTTRTACSRTCTGAAADRLLPDVLARQRDVRPDLGARQGGPARPRGAVRARRVRRAARVARRAAAQPRPEVPAAGDARAGDRLADRPASRISAT